MSALGALRRTFNKLRGQAGYEPTVLTGSDGRVLARVSVLGGALPGPGQPSLKRYTAFADYGDNVEELDIDAVSQRWARRCAELELEAGYEPGWTLAAVEERFGWYL